MNLTLVYRFHILLISFELPAFCQSFLHPFMFFFPFPLFNVSGGALMGLQRDCRVPLPGFYGGGYASLRKISQMLRDG